MTQTLTTEWLKERLKNPRTGTEFELINEVLANREAQPVYFVEIEGDQDINAGRIQGKDRPDLGLLPDGINYLYTAPPATANVKPVASREHFESLCNQFWNWAEFDEINAGEEEPRLQWDGQNYTHRVTAALWRMYQAAPPAPVVNSQLTGAPAVPDERAAFNAWNNEDNLPIAGVPAKNAAWLAWQARAMLAQPVSQGYKLPEGFKLMPIEMTDEIGEAIALEARCCGGIALDIYEAALAAAPEGGNGA